MILDNLFQQPEHTNKLPQSATCLSVVKPSLERFNQDSTTQANPTPAVFPQAVRFGCPGCHCHDFEAGIHWCYDRQARRFLNIEFIKTCHLRGGKP